MSTNLTPGAEGIFPDGPAGMAGGLLVDFDQRLRRLREQLRSTQPVRRRQFASYDEWLKAFRAWNARHHDITAIADDSRDSIYGNGGA